MEEWEVVLVRMVDGAVGSVEAGGGGVVTAVGRFVVGGIIMEGLRGMTSGMGVRGWTTKGVILL